MPEEMSRGRLAIYILMAAAAVLGVLAVVVTGNMSMEDRYANATGANTTGEEEGGGFLGFSLEAELVGFVVICAVLAVVSVLALRQLRRKEGEG
jgi:cytochrome b